MDIRIENRQPVPAIYNVKQFSDKAYTFVFYVPLSELPNRNVTAAAVKTENFTSELEIKAADSTLIMEWRPDINETKYAGKFDIQLEITGAGFVWQSYKAAYIVSASVAYDPLIYILSEGALIEGIETNISDFALIPNIEMTDSGWKWKNDAKTFTDEMQQTYRNFIKAEENGIKFYSKQLVVPADRTNIAEYHTEMLTKDGKQLYFVSLEDFSAGITALSPKEHNKAMSAETEDMYKCRCLKAVGTASEILGISAEKSAGGRNAEISFYDSSGDEYGFKFKENSNGVKVYKKYAGDEFEDVIFKVYATEEEAEADAENMPEGSVAVIKGR